MLVIRKLWIKAELPLVRTPNARRRGSARLDVWVRLRAISERLLARARCHDTDDGARSMLSQVFSLHRTTQSFLVRLVP